MSLASAALALELGRYTVDGDRVRFLTEWFGTASSRTHPDVVRHLREKVATGETQTFSLADEEYLLSRPVRDIGGSWVLQASTSGGIVVEQIVDSTGSRPGKLRCEPSAQAADSEPESATTEACVAELSLGREPVLDVRERCAANAAAEICLHRKVASMRKQIADDDVIRLDVLDEMRADCGL